MRFIKNRITEVLSSITQNKSQKGSDIFWEKSHGTTSQVEDKEDYRDDGSPKD